jgi:hypothetical protein
MWKRQIGAGTRRGQNLAICDISSHSFSRIVAMLLIDGLHDYANVSRDGREGAAQTTMAASISSFPHRAAAAPEPTRSNCSLPDGPPASKGLMWIAARKMQIVLPPGTAIDAEVDCAIRMGLSVCMRASRSACQD